MMPDLSSFAAFDFAVLTGIPVDNAENRDFLCQSGAGDIALPSVHEGSVQDFCQLHGGQIWLGPKMIAMREERQRIRKGYIVACLPCAAAHYGQFAEPTVLG